MRVCVGLFVLVTALLSSSASFAAAGQWRAALGAGLVAPPSLEDAPGPVLGASLSVGVFESLDVSLHSALARFGQGAEQTTLLVVVPAAVYKLDVLRWVPYVGAGVGLAQTWQERRDTAALVDGMLGVDYLISRRWSAGLEYRASFIFDSGAKVPLSHLVARASFHWGY